MPDASVDLILCDLPYGLTDAEWDVPLPLDQLWAEYRRVLKPRSPALLFAQQPFAADLVVSNRSWFRCEWVWHKRAAIGFLNARRYPLRAHECILLFAPRAPWYFPQGLRPVFKRRPRRPATEIYDCHDKPTLQTIGNYPRSVVDFPSEPRIGACAKPVNMLEYFIRTYSRPGAVVLDNCMGLGSTGVAAVRTGRRFIGMEIDPRRFAIAQRRIHECKQEFSAS